MRFALLIYDENTANPSAEPPDAETVAKVMDSYNGFTQALRDAGAYVGGEALQPNPTATSVRVRDGQSILIDGPFAETKEGLGGFYLIDCADLDAAIEWAAKCPGSWFGTVEVRPIFDWAAEYTPGEAAASARA
ncbi:MAG: YciI family protein [Chloroflexota bacterium]